MPAGDLESDWPFRERTPWWAATVVTYPVKQLEEPRKSSLRHHKVQRRTKTGKKVRHKCRRRREEKDIRFVSASFVLVIPDRWRAV
ncbi:hypothetical protein BV898_10594 [Hypsibius exemplaris]|uniref:Uncharacterized protein n=1 Tax=Hypsibius exemplaris TaxID=2072580 RepID=A0A1W0WJ13_HYPEX|nr:hypothetical protein BV898_10594 [Hypsibius exemplaris]